MKADLHIGAMHMSSNVFFYHEINICLKLLNENVGLGIRIVLTLI